MKIILLIILVIIVLGLNWFISHLTIDINGETPPNNINMLNKASRMVKGILCALLTISSIMIGILIKL